MADITTLSIDVELAPCPRCAPLSRAVQIALIAAVAVLIPLEIAVYLSDGDVGGDDDQKRCAERMGYGAGSVVPGDAPSVDEAKQLGQSGAQSEAFGDVDAVPAPAFWAGRSEQANSGHKRARSNTEQRHSESPAAATLSSGSMAELPGAFNGAGQGGL